MVEAYDPHGAALLDCFRGDASAGLSCHPDGAPDDVPAAFWLRATIDRLETRALEACRGTVLDVGAGVGAPFSVLQIDPQTLIRTPKPLGWRCEVLANNGGHYLARLRTL